MAKEYYCYKWVVDDEIVYIGKTMNPKLRFMQERQQDKFKPYLDAEIWTTKFKNSTEMSGMEKLLINKYQPILNVIDRHSTSMELPVDDSKLVWEEFTAIEKEEKHKCEELRIKKEIDELKEEYNDNKDSIQNYKDGIVFAELIHSMLLENIKTQTFRFPHEFCKRFKESFSEDEQDGNGNGVWRGHDILELIKKSDILELDNYDEEDIDDIDKSFFYYSPWESAEKDENGNLNDFFKIYINTIIDGKSSDFYHDQDDLANNIMPSLIEIFEDRIQQYETENEELLIKIKDKEEELTKMNSLDNDIINNEEEVEEEYDEER